VLVHQHKQGFAVFMATDWIEEIRRLNAKNANNSVLGFLVEQTVIAQIAHCGIQVGSHLHKPNAVYFFTTPEKSCVDEPGVYLHVPDVFNYKHVDAILRIVTVQEVIDPGTNKQAMDADGKPLTKKCLEVVGIQITVGSLKDHQHAANDFMTGTNSEKWCGTFKQSSDIKWSFCWVLKSTEIPASAVLAPSFTEYYLPIGDFAAALSCVEN
jgi:hypothetical protein